MNKSLRRIEFDPFESVQAEKKVLGRFMKAAEMFDKKHGRSKNTATEQLRKEGIVTKTGRLTKRYGG